MVNFVSNSVGDSTVRDFLPLNKFNSLL